MAVGVIDQLESVEVDEQQREALARLRGRTCDGLLDAR
jgi:hypothetical protein